MATPSRKDIMVCNLVAQKRNRQNVSKCDKQFPDCPEEPNKADCSTCPFFK